MIFVINSQGQRQKTGAGAHRTVGARRHAAAAGTVLMLVLAAAPARAAGDAERGRVVFAQAAGCGCHTPEHGPVGAGGGEVPTPFGTFFGTNITPDAETGIGRWTDAQIDAAIRRGIARDGAAESPAMPYYQYAGMSDADVADLIAYLRSLPPVHQPNRPHTGEIPFARLAYRAWRWLFGALPVAPAHAPAAGSTRGRYLVDHVSICGDCHTPRNLLGMPRASRYLAGAAHGPGDEAAPNITPHASGIGEWDETDIVNLLREGMLPDFDNVQGYMARLVDGHGGGPGYKHMPEADLKAIAAYLRSVPPIDNPVDHQ